MSNFDINVDKRMDRRTDVHMEKRTPISQIQKSGRCFMQGLMAV